MSTSVEVIIIKDEKGFGKLGQRKKVKLGYARNYLIPKAIAMFVNKDNLHRFEAIKQKEIKRLAKVKTDANAIKKVLEGKEFSVNLKATEDGKLYGSVTPADICGFILKESEIEIQKKHLNMPDHIKEAGKFDIEVVIHSEAAFNIKLVINPEAEAQASAAVSAPVD
ncbi:50S ribosomal protein L9, partial [Candidatus Woesearchaeota archaeon]|nr:50S ribosomal protein L9 [Candidatus Woesearchaeota archaeon]